MWPHRRSLPVLRGGRRPRRPVPRGLVPPPGDRSDGQRAPGCRERPCGCERARRGRPARADRARPRRRRGARFDHRTRLAEEVAQELAASGPRARRAHDLGRERRSHRRTRHARDHHAAIHRSGYGRVRDRGHRTDDPHADQNAWRAVRRRPRRRPLRLGRSSRSPGTDPAPGAALGGARPVPQSSNRRCSRSPRFVRHGAGVGVWWSSRAIRTSRPSRLRRDGSRDRGSPFGVTGMRSGVPSVRALAGHFARPTWSSRRADSRRSRWLDGQASSRDRNRRSARHPTELVPPARRPGARTRAQRWRDSTRDDRYKGVDTLSGMAASPGGQPDAELIVVGDGADRARLERLATDSGTDGHVRFTGRIDDRDLRELYRTASVFALPTGATVGSGAGGRGSGLCSSKPQRRAVPSSPAGPGSP